MKDSIDNLLSCLYVVNWHRRTAPVIISISILLYVIIHLRICTLDCLTLAPITIVVDIDRMIRIHLCNTISIRKVRGNSQSKQMVVFLNSVKVI